MMRAGAVGGVRCCALVVAAAVLLGAQGDDLARGDAGWASRADGAQGGIAAPAPILDSIAAYERAVAAEPDRLEARWKLLRSLHFAADFAFTDRPEPRRELLDRATAVSEAGLDRLADRVGSPVRLDTLDPDQITRRLDGTAVSRRDAARLHFWAAIAWGAWSSEAGLLSAVRQGVASRLRQYSNVTILLEPEYERGGAFRLLGRLHATLPKVPFVTGWVDRDRALPLVERAHAIAPTDPGNRFLLALTLLDRAPERRDEALALLRQVAAASPRSEMRVEDRAMRREAGERLAAEAGAGVAEEARARRVAM